MRAGSAAGQPGADSAQQPHLALQPQPVLAPHPAVQKNEFQRAAELLGTVEYADLSPVRRITFLKSKMLLRVVTGVSPWGMQTQIPQ